MILGELKKWLENQELAGTESDDELEVAYNVKTHEVLIQIAPAYIPLILTQDASVIIP